MKSNEAADASKQNNITIELSVSVVTFFILIVGFAVYYLNYRRVKIDLQKIVPLYFPQSAEQPYASPYDIDISIADDYDDL